MRADANVLAFVLAGGQGARLHPLTSDRCKPAVPFVGGLRIVDFVLSNLVNSGIQDIYVLAQYRSQSLVDYLRGSRANKPATPGDFITTITPCAKDGVLATFKGTADAVFQNIHIIERERPGVVAVFGADHVYRMDVRQMIDFHVSQRADATVAMLPVPLVACRQFGIAETNAKRRISRFHEKPRTVKAMTGSRTHALASMGNYLFNAEVLVAALRRMHAAGDSDFGSHLLPSMLRDHKVMAYDFAANTVPGANPLEERAYWRDVGTIDAYFQSCMDTRGEQPKFRIENPAWPIRPAAGRARATYRSADLVHLAFDAIVMEDSRVSPGALVRRAIIDRGNDVPWGERIGFDVAADRARFHVTPGGVVVVPAGYFPFSKAAEQDRTPGGKSSSRTGIPSKILSVFPPPCNESPHAGAPRRWF